MLLHIALLFVFARACDWFRGRFGGEGRSLAARTGATRPDSCSSCDLGWEYQATFALWLIPCFLKVASLQGTQPLRHLPTSKPFPRVCSLRCPADAQAPAPACCFSRIALTEAPAATRPWPSCTRGFLALRTSHVATPHLNELEPADLDLSSLGRHASRVPRLFVQRRPPAAPEVVGQADFLMFFFFFLFFLSSTDFSRYGTSALPTYAGLGGAGSSPAGRLAWWKPECGTGDHGKTMPTGTGRETGRVCAVDRHLATERRRRTARERHTRQATGPEMRTSRKRPAFFFLTWPGRVVCVVWARLFRWRATRGRAARP